jgi:hypothetical protein
MKPVFNFIHGDFSNWADVARDEARDLTVDELAPRIMMGREIWIIQAFQLLRQRGYPVRLSGALEEGAINILHCDDIVPRPDLWRYFMVSVRADRDPAFVSQLEVVQNTSSVWSGSDIYIPHWPQPGLIPRNRSRGDRIENIVYMGKEANLDAELRSTAFKQQLAGLGMRLDAKSGGWWDYREADVVLAVRSGYPLYLAVKPASKLVNAWMAGCPAIVSPENGYRELRLSALDYFEGQTVEDVLQSLKRLREQPRLYEDMVLNGATRAKAFTAEAIADRWAAFLDGIVSERYRAWSAAGARSDTARKLALRLALVRRRIWGTQATQTHRAGWWREALRPVRRTTVLPGSRRIASLAEVATT